MASAAETTASETPAGVPEACLEPTPVTLTPEASVAPPGDADGISTPHDLSPLYTDAMLTRMADSSRVIHSHRYIHPHRYNRSYCPHPARRAPRPDARLPRLQQEVQRRGPPGGRVQALQEAARALPHL